MVQWIGLCAVNAEDPGSMKKDLEIISQIIESEETVTPLTMGPNLSR